MNAKDIPLENRMFAMFVGKYDTGKTTSAASFPGKKFVLDFDGRIVSLRGREDVEFESYTNPKVGFDTADKRMDLLLAQTSNFPYNMVVFDSFSMAGNSS